MSMGVWEFSILDNHEVHEGPQGIIWTIIKNYSMGVKGGILVSILILVQKILFVLKF